MRLSCGIICVILRLAVLILSHSVTGRQTHYDDIYSASIASRGKNYTRLSKIAAYYR